MPNLGTKSQTMSFLFSASTTFINSARRIRCYLELLSLCIGSVYHYTMDDELAMPTSSVIGAALDASLWTAVKIDDEDLQFLRDATGIQDDDELRVHVIRVQKKAFEVRADSCQVRES